MRQTAFLPLPLALAIHPRHSLSMVVLADMDQNINSLDVMAFRCAGKGRQQDFICRNIDQPVLLCIIEMMVMLSVCVEHAVLIMDRDAAQEAGLM